MVKLRDLMKLPENFVDDLQEEQEMQDSLTIKELANEGDYFLSRNNSGEIEAKVEEATEHSCGEADSQQAAEASGELGSLTNIEAELEAELERLELNMKDSSLQQRLSYMMEIDPNFVAVVQGELRTDMVKFGSASPSFRNLSSTSTPDERKQYVSPHELTLRLHEVIKSRLEEQITELEAALKESQRKVQQLESERVRSPWRESMHSEPSSPQDRLMIGPLVMNLTGEALDAYNEACVELLKVNGPKEDNDFTESDGNNSRSFQPLDDWRRELHLAHGNRPDEMAYFTVPPAQSVGEITWPYIGMKWQSSESSAKGHEDEQ